MAEIRNRVALYAAVGPELTHYEVDVEGASLTRRGTVAAPANIHYCWPHASRPLSLCRVERQRFRGRRLCRDEATM